MTITKVILGFMAVYCGFYLVRAILTGSAQVFRHRTSTRNDHPKEYWQFVALMGVCTAIGLFFVLQKFKVRHYPSGDIILHVPHAGSSALPNIH
jgi:hypothetical protein